jgi:hypothetical protein
MSTYEDKKETLATKDPVKIGELALKLNHRWKEAEKYIKKGTPSLQEDYLDHIEDLEDEREAAAKILAEENRRRYEEERKRKEEERLEREAKKYEIQQRQKRWSALANNGRPGPRYE